ncbi:MAG: dipeptidase [Synergistaceae bacterium]|jgi:membrane dipeptidase|nr:dipeptidase [Synergistaceae bacterium]
MDKCYLERAEEFVRNSFVMDAHYDLAMDFDDSREMGESRVYSARHEGPFRAGGVNCVVSSLFIHSWQLPEMGLRKALDQISALISEEREQPDKISVCASMAGVDAANTAGRVGIIVSFEGADPLGSDAGLLQVFHRLGVRALGLAWSRRNYAADGCSFRPLKEGLKGGLTHFGVELLEEAERLGMLIDISHLNDEGVSDVARFAHRPFIASHSNCRALARSMRNLTDEQIKMVADAGGAVGMNGCTFAVADKESKDVGMDDIFAHIDHIVRLVGDDFVGLGLDICDSLTEIHKSVPNIESRDTLKDHGQIANLAAVLFEKGYSDERVGKILGGNFRRIYREVIG